MSKAKKQILHFFLTIGIVALGILGMQALTASKREINKVKPAVPAPLVRTVMVQSERQRVTIQGEGTVKPWKEIDLVPEVAGKVVYTAPGMVNGGQFRRGDMLVRIEPADYELAVTLAKAKVKDAQSNLQLVEQDAEASRQEWRHFGSDDLSKNSEPPPLVAKKPQLTAAKARLKAERAELEKALLNLGRTEIKAPFNGRVSNETVDVGQYVSPGKSIASLYSVEAAEIVVPLEAEKMAWLHVPGFTSGNGPGSRATVRARIAGRELAWPGRVVRTEGKLDERTRMIDVVVRVERPYAKRPPLAVGLFVRVDMKGRFLSDAAVIPRAALREGGIVWLAGDDGRLRFRKVDVAIMQGDKAVVQTGLKTGQQVIVTPLKAVTDGMAVRVVGSKGEDRS